MRRLTWLAPALVLVAGYAADAEDGKADEKAALARIKELGGTVLTNDKQLPVRIHLGETEATDADLALLKSFAQLQGLSINATKITDAGLASLKGLDHLHRLNLSYTRVTDKGLSQLKDLAALEDLVLTGTRVTDAGLPALKGLTHLKVLNLQRTKVTPAGFEELKKALPGVTLAWSEATLPPPPPPIITGLKNPESVAVGSDGRIYVTVIGEFDKDGDGAVMVIEDGKAVPFATGLDDPKGLAAYQDWLFVADKNKVWRIDKTGKADLFVPTNAFPTTPLFLNDLVVDPESGTLYVSDSGDLKGKGGAVYRITPKGLVEIVTDAKPLARPCRSPNGLAMDGASHLLLVDFGSGELYRIKLADGTHEKLADGFDGGDGLVWDRFGRLFISNWKNGKVWVIPRPGDKADPDRRRVPDPLPTSASIPPASSFSCRT